MNFTLEMASLGVLLSASIDMQEVVRTSLRKILSKLLSLELELISKSYFLSSLKEYLQISQAKLHSV